VYTLPVTISATGVIPHTLRDFMKRLHLAYLLNITIPRPAILNTRKIESS